MKDVVKSLEGIVLIEQKALAEDDLGRQSSQHNMATVIGEISQYCVASQMTRYYVDMPGRVPDHDHPDRVAFEGCLKVFKYDISG